MLGPYSWVQVPLEKAANPSKNGGKGPRTYTIGGKVKCGDARFRIQDPDSRFEIQTQRVRVRGFEVSRFGGHSYSIDPSLVY